MPSNHTFTQQAVERREHNKDTEARRVISTDPFGGLLTEGNFTVAIEYDVSNNPIYIGKAQLGIAKNAAKWQIKKLTWSGSNMIDLQWPNASDAFLFTWNDRASYSYS